MDDFSVKQKKNIWKNFEHFIWRELQQLSVMQTRTKANTQPHFLLALSGGADSVALLYALKAIQTGGKITLSAMYVHHGDAINNETVTYRNSCEEFCQKLCAQLEINFAVSEKPLQLLKSEESLRDFRYQQLSLFQAKLGAQILVTAHHSDDLLETRLLRLIRGTGPDGLPSMHSWQTLNENQMNFIWRPLLKIAKQDLQKYLTEIGAEFVNDPSNFSSDYLRNWIRNEWLPQLEQRAAGSVSSLARSLEILVENLPLSQSRVPIESTKNKTDQSPKNGTHNLSEKQKYFVHRIDLMGMSLSERKQCIVQLLKSAKVKNISQGRVNEILKQLDNPQKMHKFTVGDTNWVVDAERVFIELK